MDLERFFQNLIDGVAGMERTIGVLEDHLDLAPVGLGTFAPLFDTVDGDFTGPVVDEPGNGAQHGRFARAGFPDQTETFALGHAERDIAHGMDGIGTQSAPPEDDVEMFDVDHRTGRSWVAQAGSRLSVGRSSPSPPSLGRQLSRPRV